MLRFNIFEKSHHLKRTNTIVNVFPFQISFDVSPSAKDLRQNIRHVLWICLKYLTIHTCICLLWLVNRKKIYYDIVLLQTCLPQFLRIFAIQLGIQSTLQEEEMQKCKTLDKTKICRLASAICFVWREIWNPWMRCSVHHRWNSPTTYIRKKK